MASLATPAAARSTIFARITSRYGDVYFRVHFEEPPFRDTQLDPIRAGSWHRPRVLPGYPVCQNPSRFGIDDTSSYLCHRVLSRKAGDPVSTSGGYRDP
jgi:hypothetical protein